MTTAITPIESFKNTLTQMMPQLKAALPAHVTPEKFGRTLLSAVQQNPMLLEADRTSLWGSVMKAASDGLNVDGRESIITVFKMKDGTQKATYMPMVGGILKKIRNSGELHSITSQIIHKNDVFKFWVDESGEKLNHEPDILAERGDPVGVYALARTKDGGVYIEVLSAQDVQAVKNMSRSKDSGPWGGPFYLEMWKKTAIRRLSKKLPTSSDLDEFIRQDDHAVEMEPETPVVMEQKSKVSQLIEASNG